MDIYDYTTRGGKNVITNYIDKLSAKERLEIYDIRQEIFVIQVMQKYLRMHLKKLIQGSCVESYGKSECHKRV